MQSPSIERHSVGAALELLPTLIALELGRNAGVVGLALTGLVGFLSTLAICWWWQDRRAI